MVCKEKNHAYPDYSILYCNEKHTFIYLFIYLSKLSVEQTVWYQMTNNEGFEREQ